MVAITKSIGSSVIESIHGTVLGFPVRGEYTNMPDCKQHTTFSAKNILKAGSNPLTEHFGMLTVGYSETK